MTIKPIRNASDLSATKTRLASLLAKNSGEFDDEIEVLTTLIEQYEEKFARVDAPDPIAAIKFRMEEKGLSPRQLEPFIGSRARVSEVLTGKRSLSIDMIRSLHEGLGIPYASLVARPRKPESVDEISGSAIRHLNTLGFSLDREEISHFIPASLQQTVPSALLRKTRTQRASSKTDQGALLLWQAAVLQRAEALTLANIFDRSEFSRATLRRLAKLSSKIDGIKRALDSLSNLGIAVIVMPSLPGTFLDGAAMVTSTNAPVVGLTLRYDRADNFWFTLLHELSHICLHYEVLVDGHTTFVDDMEIISDDVREQQADALAQESLIPSSILEQVVWSPDSSFDDITTVSARALVPVAVVAGRWQRDHQNYKKFSRLIDRSSVRALLLPGKAADGS
ncbi:MAG: ImmA/IrrE family metallo-endopeptidase [Bradyrhizobium sp.]